MDTMRHVPQSHSPSNPSTSHSPLETNPTPLSLKDDTQSQSEQNSKEEQDSPLGLAKWSTFPSSLNMLTSSTPAIWVTFNFLSAAWSFRSSPWEEAWDFLTTLRRGVPFPPICEIASAASDSELSSVARRV